MKWERQNETKQESWKIKICFNLQLLQNFSFQKAIEADKLKQNISISTRQCFSVENCFWEDCLTNAK